jgi:peptide/nickel transport system substrate-binding protein
MTRLDELTRALKQGRLSRREFLAASAAAGLTAAAGTSLFAGTAYAAEPKKGGTLRIGMNHGSTTDSLDPATYTDTYMMTVGFSTHNTLTEILPGGDVGGDLAESWESSPDAKVWRFKLRNGVEFHNGKTLAVEDVIASLNHHRGEESKSPGKAIVEQIAELKADGNVVEITLNEGNADYPYLLVDYHLLIMPAVDGKIDWQEYQGTGGYILESHEPGVRSLLKRAPNYWKEGRAHVDAVEMLTIADTNARQNALTTGEVDVINAVDFKTAHLLARQSGLRLEEVTGYLHYTAPMDTRVAPFNDNNVRMALKYAVDREQMVKTILRGHGIVGNDHPISPIMPFYAELEQRQYDPDKAKYYLKQAGLDSLDIDLSAADAAFTGAVDAAVLMKEHAAKANININVIREPNDGYWSSVWMKKPWCMCFWGGRPTPDWMYATAYAEGANWNDTFWSNERFNQLLKQARAELDAGKRQEMYTEMQSLVRDDGGVVVWSFANYIYGVADGVQHEEKQASNWELDGGRIAERWWMA